MSNFKTDFLMFLGQPMTAREIHIARDAYVRGRVDSPARSGVDVGEVNAAARAMAAATYPLPKVRRPRVVGFSGHDDMALRVPVDLKYDGGEFWYRLPGNLYGVGWQAMARDELHRFRITPEIVKLCADLLADPTEEVDAE